MYLIGLNCLLILSISGCIGPKEFSKKSFKNQIILEGRVQKKQLAEYKKLNWFTPNYQSYKPDTAILKLLNAKTEGICFIMFGGTWCSDTQRELPKFLSLLEHLQIGSNRYEMWMLDMKKESKYVNQKIFDIQYVPTFLVFKEGKEIGRIIEKPKQSLELDLLEILSKN